MVLKTDIEQLPKADKAYLDFVYKDLQKLIDEGPGNEETAHSKECAYYSQTFSGGCSPAPSPSPSPR